MPAFVIFGPDHLAVLALLAVGASALVLGRRRLRGRDGPATLPPLAGSLGVVPSERSESRDDWRLRHGAAVLLAVNELVALGIALAQGAFDPPLQLCELAMLLMIWALWTLRPFVTQLAYCWALAGSLQAVLTPDLAVGFPSYWWMKFFASHGGVILSAVYLGVTGRVGLTHRAMWQVFGLTNAYAAVVGLVNWAFEANYGYLARKPMQPSLLDYFGPWPYYLVWMELAAISFLYLCYLPFAMSRRRAPRPTV